ncbi:MAG TPA: methyltransferase, partial [Clostridiales bacterium]|nr:methyltransferase [Clostridiales bacterium]
MNRRENFRKTVLFEDPECLTVDLGGNPLSSMEGRSMENLAEFLGYDVPTQNMEFGKSKRIDERILQYFDIDTRSVGKILRPLNSSYRRVSDVEYFDEWGIKRVFTGKYWEHASTPLKGATLSDLDQYPFPDPNSIDEEELDEIEKQAADLYENTDYVICGEHPIYGVFELGCWLCGFEDYLTKMALDTDFIKKFSEIILNYQMIVIEKYYKRIGKYIHYTSSGDDFATQNGLFMSPQMFKDLIKPYLAQRINHTKKYTDAYFLHHSCGSVYPIIQDLIDCGVEILNPIQTKARDMDAERLSTSFGGKIVFHGGIDTQEILPFGTKEQIQGEAVRVVNTLWRNGGYIAATTHNIQEDVPPENIVTLFETLKSIKNI